MNSTYDKAFSRVRHQTIIYRWRTLCHILHDICVLSSIFIYFTYFWCVFQPFIKLFYYDIYDGFTDRILKQAGIQYTSILFVDIPPIVIQFKFHQLLVKELFRQLVVYSINLSIAQTNQRIKFLCVHFCDFFRLALCFWSRAQYFRAFESAVVKVIELEHDLAFGYFKEQSRWAFELCSRF